MKRPYWRLLAIALLGACSGTLKKGTSSSLTGVDANGGDGDASGGGQVISGDPGPLIVKFTGLPSVVRGGTALTVHFTVSAGTTLASLGSGFATTADPPADFADVALDATSFDVALPVFDGADAHVFLNASDSTGRSQVIASRAFAIDSTGPDPMRSVMLDPGPFTAAPNVRLTLSDCSDVALMMTNEAGVPALGDPGWIACSTNPVPHSLNGEGPHNVRVWLQDAVGNISAEAIDSLVTYDATPPTIALQTFTGGDFVLAGSVLDVRYIADDNFGFAAVGPVSVQASTDGGKNWSPIFGCDALPAPSGSCSYAAPSTDVPSLRFRAQVTDEVGHTGSDASTTDVGVDATAPALVAGQFALDGNQASTQRSYVNVNMIGVDTVSPIVRFCLQPFALSGVPATPTTPVDSDACWQPVQNANGGLAPTQRFQMSPAFQFPLGPVPQTTFRVFAWLEDAVGHISTLTAAGAGTDFTDRDDIYFQPAIAPTIGNLLVTNVPAPTGNPPPVDDLCFNKTPECPTSDTAYITWQASDDRGLPPTPISLEYSTDGGITYQGVPGASALPNNSSFTWGPAGVPSVPFYVRAKVVDADGLVATALSDLLNGATLRIIAGNTDQGIGGSATDVAFAHYSDPYCVMHPMATSKDGVVFVLDFVAGLIRVHPKDGIARLMIPRGSSPLPADFSSAPLAQARLGPTPIRGYDITATDIVLDYQGGLLIYDGSYSGSMIRRIPNATQCDAAPCETSNFTIEPFIGGGTDTSADTTASAIYLDGSETAFNSEMTMTPLPNGDLLFKSERPTTYTVDNLRVRHYHAATKQISTITFGGAGYSGGTGPIGGCGVGLIAPFFDPTNPASTVDGFIANVGPGPGGCTGTDNYQAARFGPTGMAEPLTSQGRPVPFIWNPHTGRDGKVYATSKYITQYYRFNQDVGNWSLLMGEYNVAGGNCVEGANAGDTAICHVTPESSDASEDGQVFIFESGQVRLISPDNTVHTLAGQSWSYGDDGPPLNARFSLINWLDMWTGSGERKVVVEDALNYRLRELNASTVTKVAGSLDGHGGYVDVDLPPTATGAVFYLAGFGVDDTSGDIDLMFYTIRTGFSGVSLSGAGLGARTWKTIIGGGATAYPSADGSAGNLIDISVANYALSGVLGMANGNLLAYLAKDTTLTAPTGRDAFFKLYSAPSGSGFVQSHLAGTENQGPTGPNSFCPAAAPTGSTALAATCDIQFPANGGMKASYDAKNARWVTGFSGNSRILSFQPGPTGLAEQIAQTTLPPKSFVYVPDLDGLDQWGIVYCDAWGSLHRDGIASQTGEALLPLPDGMTCEGGAMILDTSSGKQRILFPFLRNTFGGVGEYTL